MVGYADGLDVPELWARGRGVWKANLDYVSGCDLVLIVFDDVVRLVGTVDGATFHDGRTAIEGAPDAGHPLIGSPDPLANRSRNPIAYGPLRTVPATPSPRTYDQVLAAAIDALTEATQLRYATGARTDGGRAVTERIDWAELVTLAVAGAAANAGGIEAALAARPGSWEAAHVRDMLVSTLGEDPAGLLRHRTAPLRIVLRPDEWLADLGYPELYDLSRQWLEEHGRVHEWRYRLTTDKTHGERGHWEPLDPAAPPFTEPEGEERGETWDWPATAGTIMTCPRSEDDEKALERLGHLEDAVQAMEDGGDAAAYAQALHDTVTSIVAQTYPGDHEIAVVIDHDETPGPWKHDTLSIDGRIAEAARLQTPLPWTGLTPGDYDGNLRDVEQQAGRLPHQRAAQ